MNGPLFALAQGAGDGEGMGAFGAIFVLVWLAFVAFYVFVGWKFFEKANQPGWAAIVPIYNMVVILQIIGRPIWWIVCSSSLSSVRSPGSSSRSISPNRSARVSASQWA